MTDLLARIQTAKDSAPMGKRLAKVSMNKNTFEAFAFFQGSCDPTAPVKPVSHCCGVSVFVDDTLLGDTMEFVYECALDTSSLPETVY